MPWQECSIMDQRQAFVALATQEGANRRELCRRFGISRKTGYALLHRVAADGEAGLADRSRRPRTSPTQTAPEVVDRIRALRSTHPTWGGRKLHHRLRQLGCDPVPAPSTITAILRREGLLPSGERPPSGAFRRFEAPTPNAWWQMDFMGHRALRQGRVHPLTILDDHSRYLLALEATGNERLATVQAALMTCFRRHGLPWAIRTDNGPPWGTKGTADWTHFGVWLLRLGIELWHGAPYHPQTQGKVERIHRTIAADVFGGQVFPDVDRTQVAFTTFRRAYNHDRPHEALDHAVPATRYRMSERPYPETLPEIMYADDAQIRIVGYNGTISFGGRRIQIGEAFRGVPVAITERAVDGQYRVQCCHQDIGRLDLRGLANGESKCYLCP